MGVNASAWVEVRTPDGKWHLLDRDKYLDGLLWDAFEYRTNYEYYAILGGNDRGRHPEVVPIAPARGWPADVSDAVRRTCEAADAFGDWPNGCGSCYHTWFTMQELLDDPRVFEDRGPAIAKLALLAGCPVVDENSDGRQVALLGSSASDVRVLLCFD
jgi:hypothetical protein